MTPSNQPEPIALKHTGVTGAKNTCMKDNQRKKKWKVFAEKPAAIRKLKAAQTNNYFRVLIMRFCLVSQPSAEWEHLHVKPLQSTINTAARVRMNPHKPSKKVNHNPSLDCGDGVHVKSKMEGIPTIAAHFTSPLYWMNCYFLSFRCFKK